MNHAQTPTPEASEMQGALLFRVPDDVKLAYGCGHFIYEDTSYGFYLHIKDRYEGVGESDPRKNGIVIEFGQEHKSGRSILASPLGAQRQLLKLINEGEVENLGASIAAANVIFNYDGPGSERSFEGQIISEFPRLVGLYKSGRLFENCVTFGMPEGLAHKFAKGAYQTVEDYYLDRIRYDAVHDGFGRTDECKELRKQRHAAEQEKGSLESDYESKEWVVENGVWKYLRREMPASVRKDWHAAKEKISERDEAVKSAAKAYGEKQVAAARVAIGEMLGIVK